MGVRVWGVVDDRLVEVTAEPAGNGSGLRIEGLAPERVGVTADRIRAALVNAGVVIEAPSLVLRLDPPLEAGRTEYLDVALALAALGAGVVGDSLRWIYARGRLRLDGTVVTERAAESVPLADVLDELCQWGPVESEHAFDTEKP